MTRLSRFPPLAPSPLRRLLQFVLIHVGTALTVVPITSALNRVLIAEMQLSSTLVAFLITLPYWLSPIQVWFGNVMDSRVARGRKLTGWIVLGGIMAASGSAVAAPVAFLIPDRFGLGLALTTIVFLIWGVGINLASVSYLSLLSAQADREQRNRAVGIMWICMILASIGSGLFLSSQLATYTPMKFAMVFAMLNGCALLAILFGTAGLETRHDPLPAAAGARDAWAALSILFHNPVALRFFFYLLLILIGIHTQDILLEPYGAEVLGMSVAQTSRLISYWGTGLLITMLISILVVRAWGERRVAIMGSVIVALAFALICWAGGQQAPHVFLGAVVLLGLGGGFMTHSNLVIMLRMTIPEARSLYIAAWGVANFMGQSLIIVPVSLGESLRLITNDVWLGYTGVFALEAITILLALFLLRDIRVSDFRAQAQALIARGTRSHPGHEPTLSGEDDVSLQDNYFL